MKDRVWTDLKNGLDGGYIELLEMEPQTIVDDLYNYADYKEDEKEEMLPHVISWLEEQKLAKAERG